MRICWFIGRLHFTAVGLSYRHTDCRLILQSVPCLGGGGERGGGGGGGWYLDGLRFNNLGSALPVLAGGHNQIGRFHSAPAPHFASLTAVPVQAALQLVCLSTVEASVTPSDYVHTAAANC